ncbi:MAG: HlyC/CorC family transporter [Clostridia bacterium]|nr:HlyC/CorC family transporter [Clostridia bacterium]
MSTQITIMLIMLVCSAYFSATETAFSSLNKTRIKTLAEKGNKRAERVLNLSEKYDKLLSTILIGNNIVNIVLSSICTVFCIDLAAKAFTNVNPQSTQSIGTTLATVISTVAVLIFGEITPKSLAKEYPERFAMVSAPLISFLMVVLTPLSLVFGGIKLVLGKVVKSKDDHKMTQDELLTFVDEVEQEGGIDKEESELLRSAIEFTDREASDILTPRTVLEAVDEDSTNDEIAKIFSETGYSRLPVYSGSIDSIVGIIHQKDFFGKINGTDNSVMSIVNKPVFIPLSMKISDILKLLQKNKSHIAVVVDEYGGTTGIVTMEDILEELVGEIWDEHDEVVEDFVKLSEDTYRILCSMDLDKMFKFFEIEDETDSATVSGWVLEKFGCFPQVGEKFEFSNIAVEVLVADDQRVSEIQVTVKAPEETENEEE